MEHPKTLNVLYFMYFISFVIFYLLFFSRYIYPNSRRKDFFFVGCVLSSSNRSPFHVSKAFVLYAATVNSTKKKWIYIMGRIIQEKKTVTFFQRHNFLRLTFYRKCDFFPTIAPFNIYRFFLEMCFFVLITENILLL